LVVVAGGTEPVVLAGGEFVVLAGGESVVLAGGEAVVLAGGKAVVLAGGTEVGARLPPVVWLVPVFAKSLLPGSFAMICGVPVPATVGPEVTAPDCEAKPGGQPVAELGVVV
jgi:hypothetical protein